MNDKNIDAIQKEILNLLDGLTFSSAKTILMRLLGDLELTAIVKIDP